MVMRLESRDKKTSFLSDCGIDLTKGINSGFCRSGNKCEYTKVEIEGREGARFINICGVFVDVDTGDIALGMFPNSYSYIVIDNLFNIFEKEVFKTDVFPDFINKNLLIEELKLSNSIEDFCSRFSNDMLEVKNKINVSDIEVPYESLIMNLAYVDDMEFSLHDKVDLVITRFFDNINNVFKGIFSFISNIDKYVGNIFSFESEEKFNISYMEHLRRGSEVDLLNALGSYGFGRSQRMKYRYKLDDYMDLMSMSYIDVKEGHKYKIIYNLMDFMRGVGFIDRFSFALDVIQTDRNKSLYDSLINKFDLYDIMLNNRISEIEFVKGIDRYNKLIRPYIEKGCLNNVVMLDDNKKSLMVLSNRIVNSGMVLNGLGKILLKRF